MKTFTKFKDYLSEAAMPPQFAIKDNVKIIKPKDKFFGEIGTVVKIRKRSGNNYIYRVKPQSHPASFIYLARELQKA